MERVKKIIISYIPKVISLLFFIIPFFWLKGNEMDLGGDSSRLYFYDPLSYLFSHTLYGISSSGLGIENISYYALPFILLLALFKYILSSPTILISAFNGVALSVSFFSVFIIVKDLLLLGKLKKNVTLVTLAAIVAGMFYAISPVLIDTWDKAIITRNQFFLNPLIFSLLLRYFLTEKKKYIWITLLITFIFSANFSYTAAPPFFAFYPIALLYLLLLRIFILKKPITIHVFLIAIVLFILLHAFHLLPQIASLIKPGSPVNQFFFSEETIFSRGLGYFSAIAPNIKLSKNIAVLQQGAVFNTTILITIVFPSFIFLSFVFKKNKLLQLTGVFFLIALFFASANITSLGVSIYKFLFSFPGFAMFRNFYGQWMYVYYFFYTLLLGQAIYFVLCKLSYRVSSLVVVFTISVLIFSALPFLKGDMIDKAWFQSRDIKIVDEIDPSVEESLEYMKSLPESGKVLTLPLSDPGYQMFMGKNEKGVYQGPSAVAYLTGKKDFAGITELGPFMTPFLNAVENNDTKTIVDILTILNIDYIFYNSDKNIYELYFPTFPFYEAKKRLPRTQRGYSRLLNALPLTELKRSGPIVIYKVNVGSSINKSTINFPKKIVTISNMEDKWNYYLKRYDFAKGNLILVPSDQIDEDAGIIHLEEINQEDLIIKDYPVEVIYPYVRWELGSPLYNFVLYRENDKKQKITSIPEKFTLHLDLASKRISELNQWGDKMSINYSFKKNEKPLFTSQKIDNLNTWEASLYRFFSEIESAAQLINDDSIPTHEKILLQRKLFQTYRIHKSKLNEIITRTQNSNSYLLNTIDEMFLEFEHKSKIIPISGFLYKVDGENIEGNYEVTATYDKSINIDMENSKLHYNGALVPPVKIDKENNLISYGKVKIATNASQVTLFHNPKSITSKQQWRLGEDILKSRESHNINEEIFTFPDNEKQTLLVSNISNWQKQKKYIISFDYHTFGNTYEFSLFLQTERKNNENIDPLPSAIFRENKNSRQWTPFTILIDSNDTSIAELVISSYRGGKIGIKNFSLTEMHEQPQISLETEKAITNLSPPMQDSVMINPTKYAINIKKVKSPFIVVLPQYFDRNWEMYLVDSKGFNNHQYDRFSFSSLINVNNLQSFTGKKITPKHFVVNGYANGWKITPEDLSSMQDATLIIEFKTQKIFYIGVLISVLSLLFVVGLLSVSILKKIKSI
jgi:hypothetical protein